MFKISTVLFFLLCLVCHSSQSLVKRSAKGDSGPSPDADANPFFLHLLPDLLGLTPSTTEKPPQSSQPPPCRVENSVVTSQECSSVLENVCNRVCPTEHKLPYATTCYTYPEKVCHPVTTTTPHSQCTTTSTPKCTKITKQSHQEVCTTEPTPVCFSKLEQVCHTHLDTIISNSLVDECHDVVTNQCGPLADHHFIRKRESSADPAPHFFHSTSSLCPLTTTKHCHQVPRATPHQVPRQVCVPSPREVCLLKTKTTCKLVPRQVVSEVCVPSVFKTCVPITKTVVEKACHSELVRKCDTPGCAVVPRQECRSVPKKVCQEVQKEVKEEVCDDEGDNLEVIAV